MSGPIGTHGATFVRYQGVTCTDALFGPKAPDHPSVGRSCPACGAPFVAGDYTTLVPLGPGADEERRARCRDGRFYKAMAVECHVACATGEEA